MRTTLIATTAIAAAALLATPAAARHHPYAIERSQPVMDPAALAPYGVGAEPRRVRHHRARAERHAPGRRRAARRPEHRPERDTAGKAESLPATVSRAIGNVSGMNAAFVAKLRAAFAAIPGGTCRVGSGFRSHSEQARLYRAKPGLAARPGHSNHERGLAADLSCNHGALAWLHRNASRFGLRFPMSYESWHIEPEGATRLASRHGGRHARHVAMRHHRRVKYAHAG